MTTKATMSPNPLRPMIHSAVMSAIMAVSVFALVIGPDPVRYAAGAAMLALAPVAALAIRLVTREAPETDPMTVKNLDLAPAARADQVIVAMVWLGFAGACAVGVAAFDRYPPAQAPWLQPTAVVASGFMAFFAAPVLAGLIGPAPVATLGPSGVRLTAQRILKWRDIEKVRWLGLWSPTLVITLKPSPRDPFGPSPKVWVRLPAVTPAWLKPAAKALVARNLATEGKESDSKSEETTRAPAKAVPLRQAGRSAIAAPAAAAG